jgi:hypothetical protein
VMISALVGGFACFTTAAAFFLTAIWFSCLFRLGGDEPALRAGPVLLQSV